MIDNDPMDDDFAALDAAISRIPDDRSKPMPRELNKPGEPCYRTVCTRTASCGPHKDMGSYYCEQCARTINRYNGNSVLIPLKVVTDPNPKRAVAAPRLHSSMVCGMGDWSRAKLATLETATLEDAEEIEALLSDWVGNVDSVPGFYKAEVTKAQVYVRRADNDDCLGRGWEHWSFYNRAGTLLAECVYPTTTQAEAVG